MFTFSFQRYVKSKTAKEQRFYPTYKITSQPVVDVCACVCPCANRNARPLHQKTDYVLLTAKSRQRSNLHLLLMPQFSTG